MRSLLSFRHFKWKILLRPANEVCEGYVYPGVCLSIACWDTHPSRIRGRHPLCRHPPVQCSAWRSGRQAGGTYLTGMHSCFTGVCLSPREYGSRGGIWYTIPYRYWHLVVVTEAGGTYPTAMLSCLSYKPKPKYYTNSLLPTLIENLFFVKENYEIKKTNESQKGKR